jgi:hypothetical protein
LSLLLLPFVAGNYPVMQSPWSSSTEKLQQMTKVLMSQQHLTHLTQLKRLFTVKKARTCLHFDDIFHLCSPLGVYLLAGTDIDVNYKGLFGELLVWLHCVMARSVMWHQFPLISFDFAGSSMVQAKPYTS